MNDESRRMNEERLEVRYLSASERVERLTPSLLAKAFRGELVSQEQGLP